MLLLANINGMGEGLLAAVFLLCGFAAVFSLVSLRLEVETAKKIILWARRAVFGGAAGSVFAVILLADAFLKDDFSIAAVARFSSIELGSFYKLSALWAGGPGSLLLWTAGVLVIFAAWVSWSKTDNRAFDAVALSIGAGVCMGFVGLCVFAAKPFAAPMVTLDDGMGLNPLLQNFWNVVHPPLLFIGYSAFLIPFVVSAASILAGSGAGFAFCRQMRRWLLFGICFLGLGIATGARWSYVELGWGGYWAWDPVENASLLPWLMAVAAMHSMVGVRVADKFRLWTVALAPVPFILCLIATFITRSGILVSVHSFGQSVMSSALLAFIGCCFLLWLICILRAAKVISIIRPGRISVFELEKSSVLFWANVIFIFTTVVIGTATFWPVIWRIVTGGDSGFVLTRIFYDRVISAVAVVLAFLIGINILLDFQKFGGFKIQLWSCCGVGLICSGLAFRISGTTVLTALACGMCAFSFLAVLIKLWFRLIYRGRIGGDIAHLGLLLLIAAAGLSAGQSSVEAELVKGQKIMLGKYTITYDAFEHKLAGNVTKVGPEIIITRKGWKKRLWPHNSFYPNGQSTAEVAVHTTLLEDIYICFYGVDKAGRVIITAMVKPFMLWLWCAAGLIAAGSALAIFEGKKKEYEK